jgi:hypothetical protein
MGELTITALVLSVAAIGFVLLIFFRIEARLKKISLQLPGNVGISFELQEAIRQEVSRAQKKVLQTIADIDLKLLDLDELRLPLEKPSIYRVEDELKKFELIDGKVKLLETQLSEAAPEEKVHVALALRELYPLWLYQGRQKYASSPPYQDMKKHVEEKLKQIGDTLK